MPLFDLPLEQLQAYKPDVLEPDDFDDFWRRTLAEARAHPLNASFERVDSGLTLVESYDVTFAGYGGQPVRAWLTLPAGHSGSLPCVVEYIGYTRGRGLAAEHLFWANAGFAHLLMDTRGQGSSMWRGATPDMPDGANPHIPGFMTQGILNPENYYYRRVFTDAVRAIETARSHDAVDAERVALTGGSQGGGITIAAAALVPDVQAAMPDVPFLCHYRRAVELVDTNPYAEITKYLSIYREHIDTVWHTLSYFDGVSFASRVRARALFSVGLMDMTCPPSTVYAAYNNLGSGDRDIKVYPYNQHEGGFTDHAVEKLRLLRQLWD